MHSVFSIQRRNVIRAGLTIVMIVVSVWVLELARKDVIMARVDVGQTPVTEYSLADGDGPVVVVGV